MTTIRPLEGRVAFITGAARGQGRAHAIRLARDGASIIALDLCDDVTNIDYPQARPEDLAETARLVEAQGSKIVTEIADVRDYSAVKAVFDDGVAQLGGRVDIVIANAGVVRFGEDDDFLATWNDIIGVNLTGVFHTVRAAIPTMIAGERGGSIVITSSSAGIRGTGTDKAGGQAYAASKRGVVGLMQVLANELAKHSIRVNTIHPTGVISGMTQNDAMAAMVAAGDPGLLSMVNALPIEILRPEDIANAVGWLVSDEAHYITGIQYPLDAGFTVR
jgi:SDR family mycofactocin-dependent oxidoreductase